MDMSNLLPDFRFVGTELPSKIEPMAIDFNNIPMGSAMDLEKLPRDYGIKIVAIHPYNDNIIPTTIVVEIDDKQYMGTYKGMGLDDMDTPKGTLTLDYYSDSASKEQCAAILCAIRETLRRDKVKGLTNLQFACLNAIDTIEQVDVTHNSFYINALVSKDDTIRSVQIYCDNITKDGKNKAKLVLMRKGSFDNTLPHDHSVLNESFTKLMIDFVNEFKPFTTTTLIRSIDGNIVDIQTTNHYTGW